MEKVIDRLTYNRKNLKYNYKNSEKTKNKKTSIFYEETVISVAIIIGILIGKIINLIYANDLNSLYEIYLNKNEKIDKATVLKGRNLSGDVVVESENNENKNIIAENNFEEKIKMELDIHNEMMSPLKGTITSRFGYRDVVKTNASKDHKGLDIAAKLGSTIIAAHDGEVIKAREMRKLWELCYSTEREIINSICTLPRTFCKRRRNYKKGY